MSDRFKRIMEKSKKFQGRSPSTIRLFLLLREKKDELAKYALKLEPEPGPEPLSGWDILLIAAAVCVGAYIAFRPSYAYTPSDPLLPEVAPPNHEAVYALQDEGTTHIKIGKALRVESRSRQLQTGNPNRLRLVGWWPGYTKLESQIHNHLASERGRGEWFKPSPKTLAVLRGES